MAIRQMKSGKAAGLNSIPAEVLNLDVAVTTKNQNFHASNQMVSSVHSELKSFLDHKQRWIVVSSGIQVIKGFQSISFVCFLFESSLSEFKDPSVSFQYLNYW
ncbi:unnamed protein product [Schistosoma margrebowiei]|uniref:Uncharacterized protein n=1 Tax=Schistosoma margrebowiei TaxID=48269 RepID=A0A183LSF5_9TREM|nr:unnamed protein product [Schistosoma margrebowiei]